MTRTALLALPSPDLHRLADAALSESAARYGWAAHRAATLPRWLLVEVVLTGWRRAASKES